MMFIRREREVLTLVTASVMKGRLVARHGTDMGGDYGRQGNDVFPPLYPPGFCPREQSYWHQALINVHTGHPMAVGRSAMLMRLERQ